MSRLLNWIAGFMAPKYVKNIVRHGTNALGVWLVTVGNIDPEIIEQWVEPTTSILTGLVLVGLSFLASLANSRDKD